LILGGNGEGAGGKGAGGGPGIALPSTRSTPADESRDKLACGGAANTCSTTSATHGSQTLLAKPYHMPLPVSAAVRILQTKMPGMSNMHALGHAHLSSLGETITHQFSIDVALIPLVAARAPSHTGTSAKGVGGGGGGGDGAGGSGHGGGGGGTIAAGPRRALKSTRRWKRNRCVNTR
jgi:hypothetical protein